VALVAAVVSVPAVVPDALAALGSPLVAWLAASELLVVAYPWLIVLV